MSEFDPSPFTLVVVESPYAGDIALSGEETMRPCPSTPWTWGGRRLDMPQALARGLVPLNCRDPRTGEPTLNEGFALAGGASAWMAAGARPLAGGPRPVIATQPAFGRGPTWPVN